MVAVTAVQVGRGFSSGFVLSKGSREAKRADPLVPISVSRDAGPKWTQSVYSKS